MPTVILLDNSLSMCKYVNETNDQDVSNRPTKKDLAHLIINRLIYFLEKNDQFEYLALIAFSSNAEIVSEFTKDYSKTLSSLKELRTGDTASLEEGLNKVSDLVIDEWACFTNIQILLITDNSDNMHQNSVKNLCAKLKENRTTLKDYYLSLGIDFDEKIHVNSILNDDIYKSTYYSNLINKKVYFNCKYPFSFPNRFDIVCLDDDIEIKTELVANDYDKSLLSDSKNNTYSYGFDDENFKVKKWTFKTQSKLFYLNELIELNNSIGNLYKSKNLNKSYIENQFCDKIFNQLFVSFICKLKCGNLESNITLIPAPIAYKGYQNLTYVVREISRNLDICGFMNISELVTPPTISRHLILSNDKQTKFENIDEFKSELANDPVASNEIGVISFAVLLHTSLKSENMAAIVNLGENWFGAVHCWQDAKTDPKKKSNLMLTIFVPGNDVIQSIISKLTQSAKQAQNSSNTPSSLSKAALQIKSYTKGSIIWYRPDNLVSDLQKIIRNAKKMQDKLPVFYKELNRVRKAALSFGFYELFEGIAQMFQRELSNSNNQETLMQLNHCIQCLRSPEYKDYRKDILPFVSNALFNRKINK